MSGFHLTMRPGFIHKSIVLFAMGVTLAIGLAAPQAWAQTEIRPPTGGKRLLYVDSDGSIRPAPGVKRPLYVDGDTLRDAPGGKRLLSVDGDDVLGRTVDLVGLL